MLHVHITLQSREFSIQNPILHAEDKKTKSCVSYKTSQATPVAPETFQTFQSYMTFQPFQAILQCSSISRESTRFQHSPIRMHILQFYKSYSSIGFHRKLHRVPVGQLQTLQTFILQRKGDVAISVKLTDSPE